jgi:uncharacterized protein (DUF362 family)
MIQEGIMSTVTIVSCPTYDAEPLEKAIQQVAGDPSFPVVRDKIVLLKPNILSDAKASSAITTNPAVLRAVIHLLKRQGAKEILVGDSPGLQGAGFVPRASGIADVCEAEGVSWVDFTKDPPIVHPIRTPSITCHYTVVGTPRVDLPPQVQDPPPDVLHWSGRKTNLVCSIAP